MRLRDLRFVGACGLGAAFLLSLIAPASADVKLPAIFGDNMVLQRGLKVPVWGWASPGEKISVRLAGLTAETAADAEGNWRVTFQPLKGGGILDLTVAGSNTVGIKNILLGEVWVCSGQSNMEMSVASSRNAPQEIAAADYPNIRLFTVAKAVSPKPESDCKASGWQPCSPTTVGGFSAAAYFFGRELHKRLDVPVGLIHTSWGGTPAESWTSRPSLAKVDGFQAKLAQLDQVLTNLPEAQKQYDEAMAKWQKAVDDAAAKARAEGKTDQWPSPTFEAKDWKTMKLPQNWEQAGLQLDGVVWFRREVDLPADWAGKDLALSLGPIDDDDVTYFNGQKVGETQGWTAPRRYDVPGKLVQAGRNVLVVRVNDTGGGGGFHGRADEMTLAHRAAADAKSIALAGEWVYKVELAMIPKPPAPMGLGNPWMPTGLYNAMIHPLVPFAIRGAIWYQGESNAGRAYQYRALFPAMISDWRSNWGQGDFPFLFVQLANFMAPRADPGPSTWAELREAQLMTLALPKTGMAVIIDIGEAKDIHPKNKQDVGLRLALNALANTYGQEVVYSGPLYKSMKVEGGKVRLRFDHVGGGLVAKGGPLKSFAIAGEDRQFVWAKADIDGETVVVSSDKVAKPLAVRYAWADNPEGCNLYSKADLPASPFRTDDWPGVTAEAK